jgi:hypothetical protein
VNVFNKLKYVRDSSVQTFNVTTIALTLTMALVVQRVYNKACASQCGRNKLVAAAVLPVAMHKIHYGSRLLRRQPGAVKKPESIHVASKEAGSKHPVICRTPGGGATRVRRR